MAENTSGRKLREPSDRVVETPNRSSRMYPVELIILHHTSSSASSAIGWLSDPVSKVSADFVVCRDGETVRLNPQVHRFYTWHAGKSSWNGRVDVNKFSVGVELEHVAGQDWPEFQVGAVAELVAWLGEQFPLTVAPGRVLSHFAVAVPKGRKTDPERFPWSEFGGLVAEWRSGGLVQDA